MSDHKIFLVVISGTREHMQMAAMTASVGAVSGSEVTVFLSMNALQYFVKGNGDSPPCEGRMGELMVEKKAPGLKMLFESAVTLGDAKIYPCSMAMDVLGVEQSDLEPWIGEPMGLTRFLDDARQGQVFTF